MGMAAAAAVAAAAVAQVAAGTAAVVVVDGRAALAARADHLVAKVLKISNKQPVALVLYVYLAIIYVAIVFLTRLLLL